MADLDGDGNLDLLSGSWPGEIFLFMGGPKRTFAAPAKLRHKDGKILNVGGGVRPGGGNMILVAGDATFENKNGATVIVYEGERIEIPKGKQAGITGTASAVHAVDWDGDGDLDLLVGEIGGTVSLVPNEGTAKAWAFGKEVPLTAGGADVRVQGDAGPCVADWDGDGDPDLLVGSGDGSVSLYRNAGGVPPKLGAAEQLVPPGEAKYGDDASETPVRGHRSKVCAADWNGDGRLDLLVGDFATQKLPPRQATAETKAAEEAARKELEAVKARYTALAAKVDAADEKAKRELEEVGRKWQELQAKLPQEYENHGWVWLFLRKGA